MNVSFTTEESDHVEFNSDGDVLAHYDIMNFQIDADGAFSYVKIGDWNNHTLNFSADIKPPNATAKFSSVCSKPCPAGFYKVIKRAPINNIRAMKNSRTDLINCRKINVAIFCFVSPFVRLTFMVFTCFYRFSKRLAEPRKATAVGCA